MSLLCRADFAHCFITDYAPESQCRLTNVQLIPQSSDCDRARGCRVRRCGHYRRSKREASDSVLWALKATNDTLAPSLYARTMRAEPLMTATVCLTDIWRPTASILPLLAVAATFQLPTRLRMDHTLGLYVCAREPGADLEKKESNISGNTTLRALRSVERTSRLFHAIYITNWSPNGTADPIDEALSPRLSSA